MSGYDDYKKELDRFFDDLELKKRDTEVAENDRKFAEETALTKIVATLVECGWSEGDALKLVKESPRGRKYFGNPSN